MKSDFWFAIFKLWIANLNSDMNRYEKMFRIEGDILQNTYLPVEIWMKHPVRICESRSNNNEWNIIR